MLSFAFAKKNFPEYRRVSALYVLSEIASMRDGGWQEERQIDTRRSVKRRKTKHTLKDQRRIECHLSSTHRTSPWALVECVRQGGEAVKSIQCFVLSDVKRIGRDKTHAREVNQPTSSPSILVRPTARVGIFLLSFSFLIRFFLLIDELLSYVRART